MIPAMRSVIGVIDRMPKLAQRFFIAAPNNVRTVLQDFIEQNAVVLGVSRDSVASHERFRERQELAFDLLSDGEEKLCQAFDVIRMKNMYGKQVRGIERSTFLIDPDGNETMSENDNLFSDQINAAIDAAKGEPS